MDIKLQCYRLAVLCRPQRGARFVLEVKPGGIFISYRRQESSHRAGRLYDRLIDHFGADHVFIDIDTIEPGVDFTQAITQTVTTCQVLLVVIGPRWLNVADDQGRRRLDDPDDLVRLEVEVALARNVRVIPILLEDTVMPRRQDLPESLANLSRRNAFTVRHETFRHDAERLVALIDRILGAGAAADSGPPGVAGVAPAERVETTASVMPEARSEEPAAGLRRWHLELLSEEGPEKSFRLSSTDGEAHVITVRLLWLRETIDVDGQTVVRGVNVTDKEYSLDALGRTVGSPVTIKVERGFWAQLQVKEVNLKIGDQWLSYVADAK